MLIIRSFKYSFMTLARDTATAAAATTYNFAKIYTSLRKTTQCATYVCNTKKHTTKNYKVYVATKQKCSYAIYITQCSLLQHILYLANLCFLIISTTTP